jgi:hypothetical protein
VQHPADPHEKKAMTHTGQLVSCALDYRTGPARIAGLLKYKKHEWIILALVKSKKVTNMWWNKGPDGTRVWSLLQDRAFETVIRTHKPEAIAILHNHPNSDPSRYRCNVPSKADLTSADYYYHRLRPHDISLLEFICERGAPYLYYAAFAASVVPVGPIISEVQTVNGIGIFKNYVLRKELKRKTSSEQIAGPNGR